MMALAPGFTHTEFHSRAGIEGRGMPEFLWQDADEVVERALQAYEKGRAVCVPGALNVNRGRVQRVAPAGVTRRVAGMVTRRTY